MELIYVLPQCVSSERPQQHADLEPLGGIGLAKRPRTSEAARCQSAHVP
jgi:hypothetical protein